MFGGWGAPRVVLEPGEELSIHYGLVNHLVSRKKIVSHLVSERICEKVQFLYTTSLGYPALPGMIQNRY